MHLPWQGNPLVRRTSLILLPFALLIGLAACGDAPLEPAAVPQTDGTPMTDPLGSVNANLQQGDEAVHTCFTSVATPNGPHAYRYGTITLDIPRGIVEAAGGETVRFNYRLWGEDGSLVRLANCVIPRSQAAFQWTAAWFRSAEAGNNIRWVNSSGEGVDDGSLGTMDELEYGHCHSSPEPCHVEGFIVDGDGGGDGDPDWGDDDDWGGDDPCWDCTGGGGGTDPGTGSDDCDPHAIDGGCEDAYEFRSDSNWDGTGDRFNCRDEPGSARCQRIRDAIDHLESHDNDQCRVFGNTARRIYNANDLFHFTSSDPGVYGGFKEASGLEGDRIGLTNRAFNTGELANTIAHEASHYHGWPDRRTRNADGSETWNPPHHDGRYADDWGRICRDPAN